MPVAGTVYRRADGARVRVDHVSEDQVYYVAWRPGCEDGCPLRKTHAQFLEGLEYERMEVAPARAGEE